MSSVGVVYGKSLYESFQSHIRNNFTKFEVLTPSGNTVQEKLAYEFPNGCGLLKTFLGINLES